MARIGIELPGNMVEIINCQAALDGHSNRCAVIRKALNAFFARSPAGGKVVTTGPAHPTMDQVPVGLDLDPDMHAKFHFDSFPVLLKD